MTIQPFTINIPQITLDDLRKRLAATRWPDQVDGAGWDYGTNLDYLKELAAYWQHSFDWRSQEAMLNEFSHFWTEIDGFGLHFIHERGQGPNPQPLLLLHGWPDSFYRFYKLIPLLTDPARFGGDPADAFDVIVPSLPGFGFSHRPQARGGVDDVGLLTRLMTEGLGYERFGAHGGDTGSPIAEALATQHPEVVIGIHLTDIGYDKVMQIDPATFTEAEQAYAKSLEAWSFKEGAYIMMQGSKPQTLAYGLNDSPVGLAAWIVEKFRTWTDANGNVERYFTKDELLTNITIYWATETINSSMRRYYDGFHADWGGAAGEQAGSQTGWDEAGGDQSGGWAQQGEVSKGAGVTWGGRSEVPAGLALFPKDNPAPREMAERFFNVQRWTEMPRGGHFAALEEPHLLAEDLRAFFHDLRNRT